MGTHCHCAYSMISAPVVGLGQVVEVGAGAVATPTPADAAAESISSTDAEGGTTKTDAATAADVFVQHKPDGGEADELDISDESDGTQKMFALAGPWVDSLARGNVIVLDELHDNLHPELVRFLVSQFHDPAASRCGAQLIFSTHDTSILTQDMLRRDQIWLCRRDERLQTSIFPVSDFRTRHSDEDLERAYRAGRLEHSPTSGDRGVHNPIQTERWPETDLAAAPIAGPHAILHRIA